MNVGGESDYPKAPPPYSPSGPPGPQPYGFQNPPYPNQPASVPPPPTTITVVQIPGVTRLGPSSACVTCPSCHAVVHTRVDHEPSSRTHLIAVLLCIFCMWPFCLVPYCLDSCQNSSHYCPACGARLGTFTN